MRKLIGIFFLVLITAMLLTACGGGGGSGDDNGTAPDTTAPMVSSTNPADNAPNVKVNGVISAIFSEAMDDSTINETTFTLSSGATGTVSYNPSTRTATFTPSTNLASSATYTATITTGVKDLAGNAMSSDHIWSFTMGSNNVDLSALTVSQGTLNPVFSAPTTTYSAMFITVASITVTPTAAETAAEIRVNGSVVASGQPSQALALNPGPNTITLLVTAPDGVTTRTYTITANRLSQEAYVKASNTETNDKFGLSVALSGDTLVAGAPYESSSATGINGNQSDNSVLNGGAAYVFTRTGSAWSEQAYIKSSNTDTNDGFGWNVAISADTLAVAAIGEGSNATGINGNQSDNSMSSSGAVYVFVRSGETWTQQAYIKSSNTDTNDGFGTSIAISGDTLVVGAPTEDSNATGINGNQADNSASGSGAVYVFVRSGETWTQQAYIKASDSELGDAFGSSVAISGDTLVVGAQYEDTGASNTGAVYVFTRTGSTWTQQANIKDPNPAVNNYLGYSVAVSGDSLAAGAYNTIGGGSVYVFTRTGSTWAQQAFIRGFNTEGSDHFGQSLAISGDTLIVGAHFEGSSATGLNGDGTNNIAYDSGAAYLFTRTGTTWAQQAYVKASNSETSDQFSWKAVAISGDTFAIGSSREDSNAAGINGDQSNNSATDSGAVYVFR